MVVYQTWQNARPYAYTSTKVCPAHFRIEKLLGSCWPRLVYSLTRALVRPVTQLQALLASSIRG